MTRIQLGFCMPADKLDRQRRATFSDDLNRALDLVSGHFDSAWIIEHLQFGDADQLEGFTTLSYMAALHPLIDLGVDYFILDCGGFPDLTTRDLLIHEVLPALNN